MGYGVGGDLYSKARRLLAGPSMKSDSSIVLGSSFNCRSLLGLTETGASRSLGQDFGLCAGFAGEGLQPFSLSNETLQSA